MFVAKVIGNVWATRKHKTLEGMKMLIVQRMDPVTGQLIESDEPTMAVDIAIDAGIGDTVLIMDEGNSARQILKVKQLPVRTLVCGVVDIVNIGGKTRKWH